MTTHPSHGLVSACISAALLLGLRAHAWSQDSMQDSMQDRMADNRRPTVCTEQYLPVCGRIGSVTQTYSNACFARAAGAHVIAQGPCRTAPHVPAPQ